MQSRKKIKTCFFSTFRLLPRSSSGASISILFVFCIPRPDSEIRLPRVKFGNSYDEFRKTVQRNPLRNSGISEGIVEKKEIEHPEYPKKNNSQKGFRTISCSDSH